MITEKKKLRVGVWLHDDIKENKGGAFGYYTCLTHALSAYSFTNAEIVFLSDKQITSTPFKVHHIKNKPAKSNILQKVLEKILGKKTDKLTNEILQYADIVYYLTPTCFYTNIPYIYTYWDISYMSSYAFPEFSLNGNFEYRKKEFDILPHKALMVFAESEAGSGECRKYLNIGEHKTRVIQIFPSDVIRTECIEIKPEKINTGDLFIHYPAQYWPHKNHYNLLLAMTSIRKTFPEIKLVLTGSDKGDKKYILKTVKDLGLEKNVIDLGFVPMGVLKWLYTHSHGLVTPTFLGPVNMPLLEAGELGCPVACTDISGHKEQLGDYGYYFNPMDPSDIAEKVVRMIQDKKNGLLKKYISRFNMDNTLKAIDRAFTELRHIRFCWEK